MKRLLYLPLVFLLLSGCKAAYATRRKNVRVLLGEFGAYSEAPPLDRVHPREAERHGFAWAYWEFAAGFGIYDPEAKVWREDLLKALIP